jgi:hypothetical protein
LCDCNVTANHFLGTATHPAAPAAQELGQQSLTLRKVHFATQGLATVLVTGGMANLDGWDMFKGDLRFGESDNTGNVFFADSAYRGSKGRFDILRCEPR